MDENDPYQDSEDISFEEKDRIWSLLYDKISQAVKKRQNFAIIFSGIFKPWKIEEDGYSAIITEDQYEILLRNFLLWSEELERYEKCTEVNKIIKQLEQWKKKN